MMNRHPAVVRVSATGMPKLWGSLFLIAAACGNGNGNTGVDAAPTIDAAPDASSGFVEAPHGNVPQVVSIGGPVLTAPKVVPIFFTGDGAMQTQVEPYLAAIAGSPYWHATMSEYGIGDLALGASIVTTDPVPTTDTALESWIASNLDGTHAGWTYDPNTIFTVFLPSGAVLQTQFGQSCQAFGGYHSETSNASGPITYALLPRCGGSLSSLTVATSHELVEAASDPLPFSNGAFQDMDPEHAVWASTPGAELGDMCEYVAAANAGMIGAFHVQRTWSNVSAAAGHDPCVPVLATPYQGAAPMLTDDIDAGQGFITKGVIVPMGSPKTIDVALFSDAPTDDFSVHAVDGSQLFGGQSKLTFAFDKTTGHNGDVLHLTITRKTSDPQGTVFLVVVGQQGMSTSIWWGLASE